MSPVRSARDARGDRLMELTHEVRARLHERGEVLPSGWVEESAQDLRAGRLVGWITEGAGPGGLAVLSLHGRRAVGHVHVELDGDAVGRAAELVEAILTAERAGVVRTDLGVTGLSETEEDELGRRLEPTAGFRLVRRFALERATRPTPTSEEAEWPPGVERVPVREIPTEQLAQLDWAAFQGTPDESFVAEDVEGDRRLLADILGGHLGRFLDEASAALVTSDHQLVGLILTSEESARRGVFLDIVVHPAHRGQGLGRRLVLWGVRALAALGHDQVRLWVTETNLPARRLYERTGFVPAMRTVIYRWEAVSGGAPPQSHTAR